MRFFGFGGGFRPEMDPRPQAERDPGVAFRKDICPSPRLKVFGCGGNDTSWEFLFSGLASSRFAFLMIDLFPRPRKGEGLWRKPGTPF